MPENGELRKPPTDWDNLHFALNPATYMYMAQVDLGKEWTAGKMQPYGNLSLEPSACILNYGQGLFEGMKAQRTPDGDVVLFRPSCNAERMQAGAKRLGMPPVPTEMFVDAIQAVVKSNVDWVPPTGKGALYVRPCLMGTGGMLGVAPAPSFTFVVYACPVGPYFKGGLSPICLKVSDEFHRAAPGGSGGVKAIGNYAPGMMPAGNAKKEGFDELLYLDAVEHKYVEEAGAANFFCRKGNTVYTPVLMGTVLPGVTRMSVIQLAKDLGYEVKEERVAIDLAITADEAWCTGTAAVIAPIGKVEYQGKMIEFNSGKIGEATEKLYSALTETQLLQRPDPHSWVVKVPVA
mmetsp:Transcript_51171/g.121618  ORF Transcript_51171/g.121618 Transcript_51171/m.121618 type:complete len:348 (-) Transcript_51171:69-1112(-)|eukprot:CAMPEP_0178407578 /NCGR_PEP_ID=MMETSP0689_2-20121128/19500_1 /TAXON_ID=160604 /ORGANISM="Amphidinium massartii, Strain CS-259" /LENGTH=347 /DNA_ID=CAMNT_0020028655 /DNA_START=75 /DNA_END=1118 /DNA_ORIENTATION=-